MADGWPSHEKGTCFWLEIMLVKFQIAKSNVKLPKQSRMAYLFDINDCPNGPAIQKLSCNFQTGDVFKANAAMSL